MPSRPDVFSSLEEKVDPSRAALLLIDMSNDFLHPEGKTSVRAGRRVDVPRAVIPVQQKLIEFARSAGVLIIYVAHTTLPGYGSASGPWLDARSRATYSVEDICLDGTWGQQVLDELKPASGDLLVKKYRYSGFAGTNLDLILRSSGRTTIICAGVSTNACVESTAREGFSLDYYVVIPGDACASWDMSLHEASLASAAHRYAVVCAADELVAAWSPAPDR